MRLRRSMVSGLCLSLSIALLPISMASDRAPVAPASTIVFGGSDNYPPFESLRDDRPHGFNIDLEDAIALSGDAVAIHQLQDWEDAMQALRNGDIDVLPMFASEERARDFLFTEPFYYLTHGIFTRIDGPVAAAPEDLDGHTVAAVDTGYAAQQLVTLNIDVRLVEVADIEAALRAVVSREVEFAILARHTARRIASDKALAVKQVSRPFWPRRYVFAVHSERQDMQEWLQYNLGLVQASGRYHDIYQAWDKELEWTRPSLLDFVKQYTWLIAGLMTIILLVASWSWALRRQVSQRTIDLSTELELRRQAEEEIRHRAYHDPLTGLPNRSQFIRDLDALRKHRPGKLAVAVIKLNGVEDVVVSFGYHVGEAMIRSFGERIQELDFEARSYLGSGIFAVASHDTLQADKTIAGITDPLQLQNMEIDPRLTVGIASNSPSPENGEELLRRARTALSAAINKKRPWQEYSSEIEPDPNSLTLLRDYWRYGTRDLEAWLQPQIDLATNQVIGAEALVRWNHPELGLVPPGSFIPLLEKSGLIYRVTEWMIWRALEIAQECRRRGLPSSISVNVSASDLLEHDLADTASQALKNSNALPEDLRLEMTESGLITEPDRVRDILAQLGGMGIKVAIDDFGTGYSSLSYLRDFPVQSIKLDRMFVSTMSGQSRHRSIVHSTISLAHELGLTVIAEGPEDSETVELLKSFRCDYAQGFIYAKPMPADEFYEFAAGFPEESAH